MNATGPRPFKIQAMVFDFDGTLAELLIDFEAMKRDVAALARELRLPCPPLEAPVLEWIACVEGLAVCENPVGAPHFSRRARTLVMEMELEAAGRATLFPFTREVLIELGRRSVKTAVITRNCREAVQRVFPDLEAYCGCLLARDDVERVKPHPDHLTKAMEALSAHPDSTLMVGDHPLDMETGKRAGVLTAGVWSGRASREGLMTSGARWTAPHCGDLVALLAEQGLI